MRKLILKLLDTKTFRSRNVLLTDRSILEDFVAATNPRIIKKTIQARAEIEAGKTVPFEIGREVYRK